MFRFIFRRILQMIPTVLGVILITFVLFNVVGGSPGAMTLGQNVSPQLLEEFDEGRGFNKPLILGLWSTTRAFEDVGFEESASPWRDGEAITYDRASQRVQFAEGTHPIPLRFSLHAETVFRWEITYRTSDDAVARLGWNRMQEDPLTFQDSTMLPAQEASRRITVIMETTARPGDLHPHVIVEQGMLELESIQVRRRAQHVLDTQFFHYLGQIARLDLGTSSQTNERIGSMIRAGMIPSLTLTVPIFAIGLIMAICLSLLCAFFRDTWLDRFFVVASVALMSINYLVWIILGQYIMAYKWGWFPVWGHESMAYLLLPVFIGVVSGLGTDVRFYRTVMLDEMYKDYVRTAFAKGVSRRRVLFTHVLKNTMITVLTNVVIAIPFLYTGSLLLESFFGIPGLGYLGINAINSSDVDVIRAIVLIGSVLYVVANLLTDICYAWVDPRVKLS